MTGLCGRRVSSIIRKHGVKAQKEHSNGISVFLQTLLYIRRDNLMSADAQAFESRNRGVRKSSSGDGPRSPRSKP